MDNAGSAERVILGELERLGRPTVDDLTAASRARMREAGAGYVRTYHVDEHVDALLAAGTLRLCDGGRLERARPRRAAAAPAAYRGLTFYNMDFSGFGGGHMDMRRAGA